MKFYISPNVRCEFGSLRLCIQGKSSKLHICSGFYNNCVLSLGFSVCQVVLEGQIHRFMINTPRTIAQKWHDSWKICTNWIYNIFSDFENINFRLNNKRFSTDVLKLRIHYFTSLIIA